LAARSWRGWFSLLVVALALFAGLAVGFFLGWREASPPRLTYHKLTFQRGTIFAARFSPDGQTIFYSAEWNGNPVKFSPSSLHFPIPARLESPRPISPRFPLQDR
jgi:hypothetical protein